MPSSSRRDHKQLPPSARPNRRRNSATLKQNPIIKFIENLSAWFAELPTPAKILLPIGSLLLIATFIMPSSEQNSENIAAQTLAQVEVATDPHATNIEIADTKPIVTASQTDDKDILTLELILPQRDNSAAQDIFAEANFDPDLSQVTLKVSNGDTLGELFTENNLSYQDMLDILKDKTAKKYLTRIKPNEEVVVIRKEQLDGESDNINYDVRSLNYQINIEEELKIERGIDGFKTDIIKTPLERRIAHAHGTINDSLFLAGQASGLNDNTIMNMAGIFQWDVDFIQDIRKGDNFTVIYEQLYKNGERVGNGEILAAEFHNDGHDFHAIRFVDESGDGNYYAPSGKSMKKAFLRAPIAISPRVTSSFNPKRFHPVHKRVRPHRGVDYGGPLNTPILAAGDGKVIFRGRKGGYGRCVIIQHGGNITTLYAHLNKFNGKVKNGSRVKQGQTIGYLGASGTVTAKHLHYEYRLNGVHRNPRTVKLPNAKALPSKYKAEFDKVKTDYLSQLDTIKRAYTLNASTSSAQDADKEKTEAQTSTVATASSSSTAAQ